jgi:hypothetical protein
VRFGKGQSNVTKVLNFKILSRKPNGIEASVESFDFPGHHTRPESVYRSGTTSYVELKRVSRLDRLQLA